MPDTTRRQFSDAFTGDAMGSLLDRALHVCTEASKDRDARRAGRARQARLEVRSFEHFSLQPSTFRPPRPSRFSRSSRLN